MKRQMFYKNIAILLALLAVFACALNAGAENKKPAVALVLGGGSARGFSHVGLIKALEENGIPVDLLVGTSMGSIVAGLYAAGYSVENMVDIVTTSDTAELLDIPMPPTGGVVDTTGLQHYLDVLLGAKNYDQLAKPFYSVVVNLATGKELALHEGKVSKGIQASMSIPGIFPPVEINGQYYVDGGVLNMVPANVAADLGADIIIAVSLEKDMKEPNYRRIATNLRLTLQTILGGYTEEKTAMADVLIVPDVAFDSSMDYRRATYFIEQGYRAGLAHIEEIKAAIWAEFPDFEFIPYAQTGCSELELQQIIRSARQSVAALPKRFTLKTEFGFDPDYSFPKLGLKFTHGPLRWFGVGYRYGFDQQEGGHELFVDWGMQNWGEVDLFLRFNPTREWPTFGLYVGGPKIENLTLEGTYVSQGAKAWQITASDYSLVDLPRGKAGLALKLTRLRPGETAGNTEIKDYLLMAAAPQGQVFPWGEEYFPVGFFLARPYLLGGVTVESPVTRLEPRLAFRAGLGSELLFFGLYPGDVSLGIEIDERGKTAWKFGLKSLKF